MATNLMDMLEITLESTATELSKPTARLWIRELERYPAAKVEQALLACCMQLKGRVTLAAIIERIDDGRPSADEAWSILAPLLRDERATVLWTEEMREAYGVAARFEDRVGARLAFKDKYHDLVEEARLRHEPVAWSACLGWDLAQRYEAVREGVKQGRLSIEYAKKVCGEHFEPAKEVEKIVNQVMHGLPTVPPADRDAGQ